MRQVNAITKMRWLAVSVLLTVLSLNVPAASPETVKEMMTAFTDVHLITMQDDQVLFHQTVLIEGNVIKEFGPTETLSIPAHATIIEGKERYLIPGLADMHIHTHQQWEDPEVWPISPLFLFLANGVTTIRDLGPMGDNIIYPLFWKQQIEDGGRIGPDILTSGKIIYSSSGLDQAEAVRKNYQQGYDFLKIYSYLSAPDYFKTMNTAQDLDLYTIGHIPYAVGLEGVVVAEMDEIAHVEELIYEFFDFKRNQNLSPESWTMVIIQSVLENLEITDANVLEKFYKEHAQKMQGISDMLHASKIPVSTTMAVDAIVVMKNFQKDQFLSREENRYLKKGYLDMYLKGDEKHLIQCREVEAFCAAKAEIDHWILRQLHASGVNLVLGTDAGTGGMGIVPGFSVHDELAILVDNGFSRFEALKTATVNAGIVAGNITGKRDFGVISPGFQADAVLTENNPLTDLETLRNPIGVMASGIWYTREDLQNLTEIKDHTSP